MKALVELALSVHEGERLPEDVSDLVRDAVTQHQEESKKKATQEIVELMRKIDAHKLGQRAEIRKVKAQLKRMTAALDDLDCRWAYAQKTNNFLPVLAFFDMVSLSDLAGDYTTLTSVPSDFSAK